MSFRTNTSINHECHWLFSTSTDDSMIVCMTLHIHIIITLITLGVSSSCKISAVRYLQKQTIQFVTLEKVLKPNHDMMKVFWQFGIYRIARNIDEKNIWTDLNIGGFNFGGLTIDYVTVHMTQ